MREGTAHVGRRSRRGDANDEIALAHTVRAQVLDRRLEPVFRTLLRSRQRLVSAGDDTLHHLGIRAVGRWHLRGVEHTEPP